jgi:3-oxoacyl-(acyl-carrier-protein) synthase
MADAGVSPGDVDLVSAHGTSTPANDISETRALKAVFGERAYGLPVTATKSMTGHAIGAAGALQAAFAVMSMHTGVVPPTINLEHPAEECDLDYTPGEARRVSAGVALSSSFAFGGVNSSLVLRRIPREASNK